MTLSPNGAFFVSHTYTLTDSLPHLQQGVGQIYVLAIRHSLMVKNDL